MSLSSQKRPDHALDRGLLKASIRPWSFTMTPPESIHTDTRLAHTDGAKFYELRSGMVGDARVYGHTTTAMHDMSTSPHPPYTKIRPLPPPPTVSKRMRGQW